MANADSATTPQNVNVSVNPLTNDSAAPGVTLVPTSVVLRDPADNVFKTTVTIAGQGTYTVNTTTGVVTFDPVPAFTGNATALTYRVTDSTGQNATSTIAVTVTPITPTAVDNSAAAAFNTAVQIPVLGNDAAGAASAPLDATSVKLLDPADGTYKTSVTIAGKGTFTVNTTTGVVTFTPVTGYQGLVGPVTYRVLDGNGTAATAGITVGVAAPAPPVAADDSATTLQGKPVTLPLLGNDVAGPTGAALVPGSVQLKDPADGTWKSSFTVAGQGAWALNAVHRRSHLHPARHLLRRRDPGRLPRQRHQRCGRLRDGPRHGHQGHADRERTTSATPSTRCPSRSRCSATTRPATPPCRSCPAPCACRTPRTTPGRPRSPSPARARMP